MAYSHALRQYQNQAARTAPPQEGEIFAFNMANSELTSAEDPVARIKALHRNHQLWSIIVRDVAMDGNALPPALKDQIANLGLWAMRYSLEAMSKKLSVAPLVALNSDMADALRQQVRGRPAAAPTDYKPAPIAASA